MSMSIWIYIKSICMLYLTSIWKKTCAMWRRVDWSSRCETTGQILLSLLIDFHLHPRVSRCNSAWASIYNEAKDRRRDAKVISYFSSACTRRAINNMLIEKRHLRITYFNCTNRHITDATVFQESKWRTTHLILSSHPITAWSGSSSSPSLFPPLPPPPLLFSLSFSSNTT